MKLFEKFDRSLKTELYFKLLQKELRIRFPGKGTTEYKILKQVLDQQSDILKVPTIDEIYRMTDQILKDNYENYQSNEISNNDNHNDNSTVTVSKGASSYSSNILNQIASEYAIYSSLELLRQGYGIVYDKMKVKNLL